MAKAINRWTEVTTKHPDASAGAQLFMAMRLELQDLEKLKSFPVNAIRILKAEVKREANYLIQCGVNV